MPHTSTSSGPCFDSRTGRCTPHQQWGVETACLVQHVVHELWGRLWLLGFVFHLVSSQNAFACFETIPIILIYSILPSYTRANSLCWVPWVLTPSGTFSAAHTFRLFLCL
jgi:hypothetical protein